MALITSFLFHFTLFRRTRKIASRNVGGPFPKFIPRYSLNISESSPWVWCADVISWLLLHTLTAVGGEFTNHHRHIFICIGQCLNVFSIKRDQMIRKSTRLFRTKKRKTNLNWLSVCDYSETKVWIIMNYSQSHILLSRLSLIRGICCRLVIPPPGSYNVPLHVQ